MIYSTNGISSWEVENISSTNCSLNSGIGTNEKLRRLSKMSDAIFCLAICSNGWSNILFLLEILNTTNTAMSQLCSFILSKKCCWLPPHNTEKNLHYLWNVSELTESPLLIALPPTAFALRHKNFQKLNPRPDEHDGQRSLRAWFFLKTNQSLYSWGACTIRLSSHLNFPHPHLEPCMFYPLRWFFTTKLFLCMDPSSVSHNLLLFSSSCSSLRIPIWHWNAKSWKSLSFIWCWWQPNFMVAHLVSSFVSLSAVAFTPQSSPPETPICVWSLFLHSASASSLVFASLSPSNHVPLHLSTLHFFSRCAALRFSSLRLVFSKFGHRAANPLEGPVHLLHLHMFVHIS